MRDSRQIKGQAASVQAASWQVVPGVRDTSVLPYLISADRFMSPKMKKRGLVEKKSGEGTTVSD